MEDKEPEVKYLHFSVEGSFITDMARSMFWEENKTYKESETFIVDSLRCPQITEEQFKEIALDIIEGRKKLVGLNSFDLVDDNENIRPLTQKIASMEQYNTIREIKDDMRYNPFNYIDDYATSSGVLKALKTIEYESDLSEISEFLDSKSIEPHHCLWLFDCPDLVYDLIGGVITISNREEFFEKLYNYLEDRLYYEYLKLRQRRYALLVKKEDIERPKMLPVIIDIDSTDLNVDDMTELEYAHYLINLYPDDLSYLVFQDNIDNWEGLIDRDGKFYSCDFGCHNMKAYNIILTYYKKFGYKTRYEACCDDLNSDNSLDKLIDHGWAATRCLSDCYITCKKYGKLSKSQIDTIWDAGIKYEISNISSLINSVL